MAYDPADLRLPPWLLRLLEWIVRIEVPLPGGWRLGVSRPGALYLAALAGVWIAAIYSGNNLLYLCGAMLAALAGGALWQGVRLLLRLPSLAGMLPRYVESGVRRVLSEPLPPSVSGAELALQWQAERGEVLEGRLRLADDGRLRGGFRAVRRGVLRFSDQRIESSFPLGLWRLIRRRCEAAELPVMPAAVSWPEAAYFTQRLEQGDEWHGLRSYVPGDALSRVHWRKVAAGTAEWSVKRFRHSEDEDAGQLLRVDLRLPASAHMADFERLLGQAWFWLAERLQHGGGALILGQQYFDLADPAQHDRALYALAGARPESGAPVGSGGMLLTLAGAE